MTLTINTNLSSLIVQNSLTSSTEKLNQAIERMTTGYKINSAKDDAAGYAIATKMNTQLSSVSVCQDNVAIGMSLLDTLQSSTDLIITHLQRMRDLVEEAKNGTYGQDSVDAIQAEYDARFAEIIRIVSSTEYNGVKLYQDKTISLQVGIDSTTNSKINVQLSDISHTSLPEVGSFCSDGSGILSTDPDGKNALDRIDETLSDFTTFQTNWGAVQNRLESASETLDVQFANITSSLSTVRDADVAKESSEYIKAQILQQASATLLATANQTPSIALNLI